MTVYLVICVRPNDTRLVHSYESKEKAQSMAYELIQMNDDESPMYVVKSVWVDLQ